MTAKPIIYEEIKHYFKLDDKGNLWKRAISKAWRSRVGEWSPVYLNKPDKLGYLRVRFKGQKLPQHRIIYSLHTKQDIPVNRVIDHLDGDPSNNSVNNLRLVTTRENCQNWQIHREGKLLGTKYITKTGRWQARITLTNGEKVTLGNFASEIEAHIRYNEALPHVNLSKEGIQAIFCVAQHSSNYVGVSWDKDRMKWRAYTYENNKSKYLGLYTTEEEAKQARERLVNRGFIHLDTLLEREWNY